MRRSRWKLVRGKLKPHILEEDVVEEITTRLWLQNRIRVWRIRERIPGQGKPSMAGIPDLVGWVKHFHAWPLLTDGNIRSWAIPLFIECKRPGGAHRLAQEQFIQEAKAGGCLAFFAESWIDVVREFYGFGIKLTT